MTTTFTFGESVACTALLGNVTRLAADEQRHPRLPDPGQSLRAALASPLGFPPLAAATVPGDHVAIALANNVPAVDAVVTGAIAALIDAGVEPELITVVSTSPIGPREPLDRRLAAMRASGVSFEQHDPEDEPSIAMVGVNSSGEPIRFNRSIAEADFILPIGVGGVAAEAGGAVGAFAGFFPAFSNRETIDRFRVRAADDSPKQRGKRAAEIDAAGWMLGVTLTVSVIPAGGGGVAAVAAGESRLVMQSAAEHSQTVWRQPVERSGDLVVAAMTGVRSEQTWENLAHALRAAEAVLQPGGAIAICSEIEQPPAGSFDMLRDAIDFEEVQRDLSQLGDADAQSALALALALEGGPVYLRSRLPAEVVESLGMTPFESDAELSRLASGRTHCVLIEDAQRLVPVLAPTKFGRG